MRRVICTQRITVPVCSYQIHSETMACDAAKKYAARAQIQLPKFLQMGHWKSAFAEVSFPTPMQSEDYNGQTECDGYSRPSCLEAGTE